MDCFSRQRRGVFSAQRRGTKKHCRFRHRACEWACSGADWYRRNEARETIASQPACAAKRCGWDCRYQSLLLESLEANLIHYFQQVADSVTLPVILYNFRPRPARIDAAVGEKNWRIHRENIVGIKDTIDSIAHLRSMISLVKVEHPRFSVL